MQKPRKSRLLSSSKGVKNRIELKTTVNCGNRNRGNQGMPVYIFLFSNSQTKFLESNHSAIPERKFRPTLKNDEVFFLLQHSIVV